MKCLEHDKLTARLARLEALSWLLLVLLVGNIATGIPAVVACLT